MTMSDYLLAVLAGVGAEAILSRVIRAVVDWLMG
jgi:hypothetical protein